MQLITVSKNINATDADLVRARLDAAGFHPTIVHGLSPLNVEGYVLPEGGILVQVPEDEAAEAGEFLAAPPSND